jgi:hypothetical protein
MTVSVPPPNGEPDVPSNVVGPALTVQEASDRVVFTAKPSMTS